MSCPRNTLAFEDAFGPLAASRSLAVATATPRSRAPTRVLARALALAAAAGFSALACGDPDRAILEALTPPERTRFLRGREVALPCWTCHDLAGRVDKVGPSLEGVFGRRSGLAPDQRGSEAMLAAAVVWDETTLASFLANPAGYVPGNRMVSPGISNGEALADLIFYLRRVSEPGARDGKRE